MGCCIGSLVSSLACCCGTAACNLCCACCPSSRSSVMTRLMYGTMIFLGTILSCIFLSPTIKKRLSNNPYLCDDDLIGEKCYNLVGYSAIHRVTFGLVSVFFLLALIMIDVRNSKEWRAYLQNGFWFFKYAAWVGVMVGGFFIQSDIFTQFMLILGYMGAFLFVIVQLVIIIELAHVWNGKWMEEAENNRNYKVGLIFFTVVFFASFIVITTLSYVYYTKTDDCTLHKIIISVNLILCIIITIVSILPSIQAVSPRSGIFQPILVSVYVMYLTWSALTSNPHRNCNPTIMSILKDDLNSTHYNSTHLYSKNTTGQFNPYSLVAIILLFLSLFKSIFTSSTSDTTNMLMNQEKTILGQETAQKVADDEEEQVSYNYSFFHLLCLLGSLYMMMSLTNWNSTKPNSMAPFWIKVSSSWVCILLYLWTTVNKLICDRDFGDF
ncbi:hypothetical protein SNEBB_005999 [Seison nebaliae]|nr:hypothetical protein SNEBB_005999 [Seison nebaliae]